MWTIISSSDIERRLSLRTNCFHFVAAFPQLPFESFPLLSRIETCPHPCPIWSNNSRLLNQEWECRRVNVHVYTQGILNVWTQSTRRRTATHAGYRAHWFDHVSEIKTLSEHMCSHPNWSNEGQTPWSPNFLKTGAASKRWFKWSAHTYKWFNVW